MINITSPQNSDDPQNGHPSSVADATPRPWSISRSFPEYINGPDGKTIIDCNGPQASNVLDIANAALIVRAVNAHDTLVKALETARSRVGAKGGLNPDEARETANMITAALKLAGAA